MAAEKKSHVRSWVFWALWVFVGAAFEIWAVWKGRKTGDEPFTDVVRDRGFKLRHGVGLVIQAGVLGFLAWWLIHWATGASIWMPGS